MSTRVERTILKAYKVIDSCTTKEQLRVAARYAELVNNNYPDELRRRIMEKRANLHVSAISKGRMAKNTF